MKSSSLNEEEETCGNEVLQIMGKLGRTEILSFTREKRKGAGGEKVSSWRNFLVKFIPQGSFVFIVEFALTFSLPFSSPPPFQIIHSSPRTDPSFRRFIRPNFRAAPIYRCIVGALLPNRGGRRRQVRVLIEAYRDGGNFAVSPRSRNLFPVQRPRRNNGGGGNFHFYVLANNI